MLSIVGSILLLGAVYFVSDYYIDHPIDVRQTELNHILFELPKVRFPYLRPEDGDKNYRQVVGKEVKGPRLSPQGFLLPGGDAFLATARQEADGSFQYRYTFVGSQEASTIVFSSIKTLFYRKNFSLAGDRATHFIELKTRQERSASEIVNDLQQSQRGQVEVVHATLVEVIDKQPGPYASQRLYSIRLTVDGDTESQHEVIEETATFDQLKPFKVAIVDRSNSSETYFVYLQQEGKYFVPNYLKFERPSLLVNYLQKAK